VEPLQARHEVILFHVALELRELGRGAKHGGPVGGAHERAGIVPDGDGHDPGAVIAPLASGGKVAKAAEAVGGPQLRERRVAEAVEVGVEKAYANAVPVEASPDGGKGVDPRKRTAGGPVLHHPL